MTTDFSTESAQCYDVIIVGGGLVGSSLAWALRASGLRIALLEAGAWTIPASADDKRIIALSYVSQQIYQGMQIWDAIRPYATPIQHIHISDRGRFGFTRLHCEELRLPALGYVVKAAALARLLREQLQDSDVTILAPAQFSEVETTADMATVKIEMHGALQTLQTRLLVAADGGNSQVRQHLNIEATERDYGQTAIIATVTLEKPHGHVAYERFTSTGPCALLPMTEHTCSLVLTVRHADAPAILALSEPEFLAVLQQRFGWRLGRCLASSPRQAYPLQLLQVKQAETPRVAVIGNAAHTLHPIAGQGLNLGLRDVATLAETLLERQCAGHDIGDVETLALYMRRQQPDQRWVVGLTDLLVNVFSNAVPPLTCLRNLGLVMLDGIPPLKRQFMQQMVGLGGHSGDLVRGLPVQSQR